MRRISVDFNTLTSEPVDLVKLGKAGTRNGDRLPALTDGERVLLYDDELEVEAFIVYDPTDRYWMARPDDATWRDLPAPATAESRQRP